jgi:hypothetical protein
MAVFSSIFLLFIYLIGLFGSIGFDMATEDSESEEEWCHWWN